MIDYNAYRKLEEKKERIVLKKKLYEHRRQTDKDMCEDLGTRLVARQEDNDILTKMIAEFKGELRKVQSSIKDVENARVDEAAAKE